MSSPCCPEPQHGSGDDDCHRDCWNRSSAVSSSLSPDNLARCAYVPPIAPETMYPAGSQPLHEIIESPEEAGPSLRRWRRISIPSLASPIFDPSSLSSSSTSRTFSHLYVHLGNSCLKPSVRDINELRNKEEWMLSILHRISPSWPPTITLSSIWQPKWRIWGLVIRLDALHSHRSGRHWRR